jgi:hypothetical protein
MPWTFYNASGQKLSSAVPGVPSGLIGHFTGSCPTGWSEYTTARGRYIVGTPSGGTGEAVVGTALSNSESRSVGQHTHTFSGAALAVHDHAAQAMDEAGDNVSPVGQLPARSNNGDLNYKDVTPNVVMHTNVIVAASAGTPAGTNANAGSVANTNAPYVQLTTCKKD